MMLNIISSVSLSVRIALTLEDAYTLKLNCLGIINCNSEENGFQGIKMGID